MTRIRSVFQWEQRQAATEINLAGVRCSVEKFGIQNGCVQCNSECQLANDGMPFMSRVIDTPGGLSIISLVPMRPAVDINRQAADNKSTLVHRCFLNRQIYALHAHLTASID